MCILRVRQLRTCFRHNNLYPWDKSKATATWVKAWQITSTSLHILLNDSLSHALAVSKTVKSRPKALKFNHFQSIKRKGTALNYSNASSALHAF